MNSTKSHSEFGVNIHAKTVEQALVKACFTLGVSESGISYKVVKEEAPKGFLSFIKSPSVEILAWRRGEVAAGAGSEPLGQEHTASLIEELRAFCAGICERVTGTPVTVSALVAEGRLLLDVDDDYMASQIEGNSAWAEAIEHLLRKKPRHLTQALPFQIFVDSRGLRRGREAQLIQKVIRLSAQVHETKNPVILDLKSSHDRKTVHDTLSGDARVTSVSVGSGRNRQVKIFPREEAA